MFLRALIVPIIYQLVFLWLWLKFVGDVKLILVKNNSYNIWYTIPFPLLWSFGLSIHTYIYLDTRICPQDHSSRLFFGLAVPVLFMIFYIVTCMQTPCPHNTNHLHYSNIYPILKIYPCPRRRILYPTKGWLSISGVR